MNFFLKKFSVRSNTPPLVILLILITVIVYSGSLRNGFVGDDNSTIVRNDFIKSWQNFPLIFTKAYLTPLDKLGETLIPGSGERSYRPIVTLSYFIDYTIWKLNPFGYHLTSLIWHVVNVLLLFGLAGLLLKDRSLAFWVALLFAVHPVNAEAVDVISFREDLLVFFFYAASLVLFIRKDSVASKRRGIYAFVSAGCFFLALFSKEMAITLPLMLIAYDYFFTFDQSWKRLLLQARSRYGVYVWVALCYVGAWLWFQQWGGDQAAPSSYPGGSLYTNLLTMAKVFAGYLLWIFLPFLIHPTLPELDPAMAAHSMLEPEVLLSIGLIIAFASAIFVLRKKKKEISFSLSWFCVALLPIANLIPISTIMASRYLYLPMAGFSIAAVLIFAAIYELPVPWISATLQKTLLRDLFLIALGCLGMITAGLSLIVKNDLSLWVKMVLQYPEDAAARRNLADIFVALGRPDLAVREYEMATQLDLKKPEKSLPPPKK